ncbi:MAG: glycosyltransferase family 4 protein [Bacteroidales bacterium]|nr:glycosyltransferase family 4 protein [Bacteroidales bacterium]
MRIKVCHITSAHPRYDVRIFRKECVSLATVYDVSLIVADGLGEETIDGVTIIDAGKKSDGRFTRMLNTAKKVYYKALEIDADIYHFHDPELLPYGKKFIRRGKKVIYDAHEDLPRQIMSKYWIPKIFRKMISISVERYENSSAHQMSCIITATPHIRKRFLKQNKHTIDINNYPFLEPDSDESISFNHKEHAVCFVGSASKIRGLTEVIEAMELLETDLKLYFAGHISPQIYKEELMSLKGWRKVVNFEEVSPKEVQNIYKKSKAGIVTFYPLPNHVNAQPNKIFEYMASGLPVIASNFPLWKDIIEKNNCGICVDPQNPLAVKNAILYIVENPDKAVEMGINGKKAVSEIYNWNSEKEKLYTVYNQLTEQKI